MTPQIGTAAIVICSIAMYQICMKSIPEGINPLNALVTFYLSALVCTLVAGKLLTTNEPFLTTSAFSWQAVLVGVAIVGIELGYLLMYRSGWHLAVAPLIGMGGAVVLLTVIGLAVFRQPLPIRHFLGLSLCLFGLYLLLPRE